jgi:hypothetical protein
MNIKLTKNALEYFADQAQKAAAEALAAQALIIETDSESDNDVEVTEAAETEE